MGRAPCCDKANVKKGPWSPEEDAQLKAYIESNGTGGNWIALPQKIGLKRCGKSCRLRWLNYLRPNIKHGGFSEEEDFIICSLYRSIGSRWSIIAAQLPGRTDNDIKNYWNTRLKKKLLDQQRKEQQACRARCLNLKQEMNLVTQALYWPLLPADSHLMDQESIRNLIIKLGGRFSDDHHPQSSATTNPMNFRFPLDGSFAQDQIYENSIMNMLSSSSSISPINSTCSQVTNSAHFSDTFQGVDGFPAEPSELIYGNNQQMLDGLMEGCYGSDNMVDGSSTGTSSSAESSSWGEMNSLCYPQIVSGFEACHQSLPQQVSTFDEPSYFGPQ